MKNTNLAQILDKINDSCLNSDILQLLKNVECNVTETGEIIVEPLNILNEIENHINTYIHENGIDLTNDNKVVGLQEMISCLSKNEDFIREQNISDLPIAYRVDFLSDKFKYSESSIQNFYFKSLNK